MKTFKPHNKKCRNTECRKSFHVATMSEARKTWCSDDCALAIVKRKREKAQAEKEKRERAEIRAAKAKIKRRSEHLSDAQDAFNAYIRERDINEPCICCGSYGPDENWLTGGKWDAGHFLSRGGFPELRFEEDNCHKQLKSCNGGSSKYARKGRTVSAGYRERLILKIGLDRVLWLEGPHAPKKYTIDELVAITKLYRAKLRELVKARKEVFADGGA